MKIALFNANGLSGKDEVILDFFNTKKIDIFCIVETWNKKENSIINNNFTNVTKNNCNISTGGRRNTGGILCFAKPGLQKLISVLDIDTNSNYVIFEILNCIIAVGYFPPNSDPKALLAFLDKVQEIGNGKNCIVMGDFNARLGKISNDHNSNTRGTILTNYILENPIFLWNAEQGRFTTFCHSGYGSSVTDLILTNGIQPTEITIHEENSLGGSDHRPITFAIQTNAVPEREFTRYNVRRIADLQVQQRYDIRLKRTLQETLQNMDNYPDVDSSWLIIKKWLGKAIEKSCGFLKYKASSCPEFWTPELIEAREKLVELTKQLQAIPRGRDESTRRRIASSRNTHAKKFRTDMTARKCEIFTNIANNLSNPQNAASLMKMLKCKNSRLSRSNCKLKADEIDIHADHFASTFGRLPLGEEPDETITPDPYSSFTVNSQEIASLLASLGMGKAAGIDGIMAEFLKYSRNVVSMPLAKLINSIIRECKIPSEWRTALIVPVFKNKGSDLNAANYRPIALTVIARRVYERIILSRLKDNINLMSDWQGGFRANRSTLDQCYVLDEIMLRYPKARHAFMDIKAAFDTVNRKRLWALLQMNYNVSQSEILRLKDLFDHNTSYLIVNGTKSRGIPNLRGLLQGSSLSPILFNFYIDPLIKKLTSENVRGTTLKVGGLFTTALAFADDIALHAVSAEKLQDLLNVCEQWSRQNGMEFQPAKCAVLGSNNTGDSGLRIYGLPIPESKQISYLGMPFTVDRIDFLANINSRCTKARSVATTFSKFGMNISGFSQAASALIYKTFIRPIMEYGLQLTVLKGNSKELAIAQKTQNFAFRQIFSGQRNTSINAMHKLLLIEPVQLRNQVLNLKFAARLHNSYDVKTPAVTIWRSSWSKRVQTSITEKTIKNKMYPMAALIPTLFRAPQQYEWIQPAFNNSELKHYLRTEISKLDTGNINVAGTLFVSPQEPHRHCLQANSFNFNERKERICIIKWLIGNVAIHKTCRHCREEISRKHAADCSLADRALSTQYPAESSVYIGNNNFVGKMTFIDFLLNAYRRHPPKGLFRNISRAIEMIYKHCLGYQVQSNGFYAAPAEEIEPEPDPGTIFQG